MRRARRTLFPKTSRLTFPLGSGRFANVLRLVKIISVLLVSLWLPATLHCRLEALGFAGFFSCPEQSSTAAHHADESDCDRDSCQSVESGQFTVAKSRVVPALLSSPVDV